MTSKGNRTEELLEQILRVMAASVVEGKTLSEGAPFLHRLGVELEVIERVYGTTKGSVSGTISKANAARKATQ